MGETDMPEISDRPLLLIVWHDDCSDDGFDTISEAAAWIASREDEPKIRAATILTDTFADVTLELRRAIEAAKNDRAKARKNAAINREHERYESAAVNFLRGAA